MVKTLHFQCKNMGSIPFKENKNVKQIKKNLKKNKNILDKTGYKKKIA